MGSFVPGKYGEIIIRVEVLIAKMIILWDPMIGSNQNIVDSLEESVEQSWKWYSCDKSDHLNIGGLEFITNFRYYKVISPDRAMNSYILATIVVVVGVLGKILSIIMSTSWISVKKLLQLFKRVKLATPKLAKKPFSFLDIFEAKVDANPDRVQMIICETGETFTLDAMDKLANQIAHWGAKEHLKQFDTVALMMLNHPDFVSLMLGFGKIGAGTAWINTNVTGKTLVHSCEVALKDTEKKILIVDTQLRDQIQDDVASIEALGVKIVYWGAAAAEDSVKKLVLKLSTTRPGKEARSKMVVGSPLAYIFTSGTTGMPKACKISHQRYFGAMHLYSTLCDLTHDDRIYCVLPLYHSAAGMVCLSSALSSGACMVLRKKFSASNFTSDCLRYKVTSFQYIGELCRYLLATPASPNDRVVSLKTAFGNGLRPEIWNEFKERFNIGRVVEFYAATEGNVLLFNCSGEVGALGYVPTFLEFIYSPTLVRTDPDDSTVPLRAASGMCIRCKPGEVGLLVMPIAKSGSGSGGQFDGYTDKKATSSKILQDVLKRGDNCFNTGDLLMRDARGFYFWSDRVGDTFRWKGENCATTEVASVIAECPGVHDNTVYGVTVPGCDGRAGMAVIVLSPTAAAAGVDVVVATAAAADGQGASGDDEQFSISILQARCQKDLPVYARPLFLRVKFSGALKTTSTFKHVKTDLVKEVSFVIAIPARYLKLIPGSTLFSITIASFFTTFESSFCCASALEFLCYAAALLCCCIAMLLHCYAAALLCCCIAMLLHYYECWCYSYRSPC